MNHGRRRRRLIAKFRRPVAIVVKEQICHMAILSPIGWSMSKTVPETPAADGERFAVHFPPIPR